MKNRMSDDLKSSAWRIPQESTTPNELSQSAQKQLAQGRQWIETYVQEHPAAGIGAALCIGVVIGWISKRS